MFSSFPIENNFEQEDGISLLLFNFALEYAIRKVQETNLRPDMNDNPQVLAYEGNANLTDEEIRNIEINTDVIKWL